MYSRVIVKLVGYESDTGVCEITIRPSSLISYVLRSRSPNFKVDE